MTTNEHPHSFVKHRFTVKKKIVVVAYPIGRIGSSALMGLLDLAGLKAGNPASLSGPAPMNPKGFFELKSQNRLLGETFKGYYPDIVSPPDIALVTEAAKNKARAYHDLLKAELGPEGPYAVKAQRFLSLALLHFLREEFDTRVIVMHREESAQVASILRSWQLTQTSPHLKNASASFVTAWLREWTDFSKGMMTHFPFPSLQLGFEALMADPIAQVNTVFRFIAEPPPRDELITGWFDAKLVNRRQYV